MLNNSFLLAMVVAGTVRLYPRSYGFDSNLLESLIQRPAHVEKKLAKDNQRWGLKRLVACLPGPK